MGLKNWIAGAVAGSKSYGGVFNDLTPKLVIQGYRRYARDRGGAPTQKTTDREIVEIYKKVATAFQRASKERGECLPAPTLNFIVLKFLTVKELLGDQMVDAHLLYEVDKYKKDGLREDYRRELNLFETPSEPPLWHQKVPEPLQCSNLQLIKDLEEIRQEFGFDHQTFNGALMTSKHMIWRSVLWAYGETRRGLPGLSDQEYFAMVLINWVSNKILLRPMNHLPTAWSVDQLKKIVDQAEHFVRPCQKIGDVYHVIVEIEKAEGAFSDPLGLILRIDSVFSAAATTANQ